MKEYRGYTMAVMAEALGIAPNTLKQRLFVANEHPITTEPIWSKKSFDKVKVVKSIGRPPKDKLPEQKNQVKKARKKVK